MSENRHRSSRHTLKEVIYTEAAKQQLEDLYERLGDAIQQDLRNRAEARAVKRGGEVIEVTASDVLSAWESAEEILPRRRSISTYRTFARYLLAVGIGAGIPAILVSVGIRNSIFVAYPAVMTLIIALYLRSLAHLFGERETPRILKSVVDVMKRWIG